MLKGKNIIDEKGPIEPNFKKQESRNNGLEKRAIYATKTKI